MDERQTIARDHLDSVVKMFKRSARYAWIVGVVAAAGIAISVFALKLRSPKYSSQAVLYYQEGLQWNVNGEATGTRKIGARLKEVLVARQRLTKIIEDLGLYQNMVKEGKLSDAVEELRNAINFRVNEGDTFVIAYIGDSAKEVQEVTAKLTETLIEENQRLRAEQAEFAKGFLDAERKRNEDNLRQKETERALFLARHQEFAQEQAGSNSPGAFIRATSRKNAAAIQAAAQVVPESGGDSTLTTLRREEERLRHQIASPAEVPARPKDPALIAAKNDAESRLATAKRDLADKKSRFTDQHPDVRAADVAVREATVTLQRATDALKAADAAPMEVIEIEPKAALEARLAQVEQDIRDYQRKHTGPTKDKPVPDEPVESNSAAQRIVGLETEWTRLNREVDEARDRFQQLDTRQFMATMAASSLTSGSGATITVIDPAYTPSHATGLSNMRFVAAGAAAAVGVGFVIMLFLGLLDDRILDRNDLDKLALAPVLIEIPAIPKGGRRRGR